MKIMVYITAVASLCSMLAFVPLFQACTTAAEQEIVQEEVVEPTDSGLLDAPPVTVRDGDVLEIVKTEELDGGLRVQYIDVTEQESIDVMKDALEEVE